MDDQNAFERQLAEEIEHEAGPPLPVDALAITRIAMSPTSRWRTRSMFSIITSTAGIGVAALVATTLLFSGQPSGNEETVAPGAEATPLVAAYVHGSPSRPSCCGPEVETYDEAGNRLTLRNMETGGTWTFDDPRLTGAVTTVGHMDAFPQADSDEWVEVWWGDLRVVNEDGAWSGTSSGSLDSAQPVETRTTLYQLTGEGAYEGLSALLFETTTIGSEPYIFGMVFPGSLPPRSLDTGSADE